MISVFSRKVFLATASMAIMSLQAHASCSGAAPGPALQSFDSDPAAWVKAHNQDSDLDAQMKALAAAAVNSGDKSFGSALSTALALIPSNKEQGAPVGKALGQLVNSCSDPRDPGDAADKKYISANISPAVTANTSVNTAYGDASGPQTASTSGGAGGGASSSSSGAGIGGQTGTGTPGGGSNGGGGGSPTGTGGVQTSSSGLTTYGASGTGTIP